MAKLGTKHVMYHILANFMQKKNAILTGWKVSSLAWHSIFFTPEHNTKMEHHRIEFSRS